MIYHGFYQGLSRYHYRSPQQCRANWRDQVERGFRTSTVYQSPGGDRLDEFVWQIDAMLDEGLLSIDCPILVLSIPANEAAEAALMATRQWPELIIGNVDDPGPQRGDEVRYNADWAHEYGFRSGTYMHGPYINEGWASGLDVVIMEATTWQFARAPRVKAEMELWAGSMYALSQDPERARAVAGTWSWVRGVPCVLIWAFTHDARTYARADSMVNEGRDEEGWMYSYAIPTPDGPPIATPGYDGLTQGIEDCRTLEWAAEQADDAIQAFLAQLKAIWNDHPPEPPRPFPTADWPGIYGQLAELTQQRRGDECSASERTDTTVPTPTG